MLKTGLLGAGRIAGVHAAGIAAHPRSRLVAVSDRDPAPAARLAGRHGAEVRGTEDILADPAIDAVLIATPTDTHSDLMETAIAAGKAVLCEKPVDLDLERARLCQQRVAGGSRPAMIGFNRRFDRSYQALKAALDAGEIGRTELLSMVSFDPAPPPASYIKGSGGLFRDMMIHDFDLSRFLMGASPVSVHAVAAAIVDPAIGAAGDVDTAVVTLTFADGRIAVIRNSRRAVYGYDQRVEILGSGGMLQVTNMAENLVVKSTADGVTGAKPPYFFLERYLPAFEAQWDAFVGAALDSTPVPLTVADGVAALAIAEAATRSRESGQTVRLADV